MRFADRRAAGRDLAEALEEEYADREVVVLGLARGGVEVAAEVARRLEAPLDALVVGKLGVPSRPELAFGAIAPEGVRVLNDDVVESVGLSSTRIEEIERREREELEEKQRLYRKERPAVDLTGKQVILVDDGLATGATMRAAIRYADKQGAAGIIAAVPVGAPRTCRAIAQQVDRLVCLAEPSMFFGVGQFYESFPPVTNDQVVDLLGEAD
jgi:predicted phosphoribosyltransferase